MRMFGFKLIKASILLSCCSATAQTVVLNSPKLNNAYILPVPPPPCSQLIGTVFQNFNSANFDSVGVVQWYAFGIIMTNGLAGTQPTCMSMTAATNGPTTATYQWAIYNDSVPTGSGPGSINGSLSASYNATALSASLTTNNYTLSMSTPFPATTTFTNWVVIKITGSTGNNDLKFGKWNAGSGLQTYSSSNGSTWAVFNTFDQWIYAFFK